MHCRAVGLVNIDAPIIIQSANDPSKTLHEFLTDYYEEGNSTGGRVRTTEGVEIEILGSGTDHAPFAYYAGIPAAYHHFKIDNKKFPSAGAYPTYHTGFETFYLVDKILDPGFALSRSSAQLNLHIILQLAETALLPFSPADIVTVLEEALQADDFETLRQIGLGDSLDIMIESLMDFKSAIENWTSELQSLQRTGELEDRLRLRMMNDQLMMLERIFILPDGIPGRKNYRHALFSPSKFNSYGLSDLIMFLSKICYPAAGSAYPGIAGNIQFNLN